LFGLDRRAGILDAIEAESTGTIGADAETLY
jgi:hypothetical protein